MKKLQEFQLTFDKKHFPHFKDISYDEKLLYFATALAGEVGEFANFVKKRHRAKVAKKPTADYDAPMKEELIDVFIYLLITVIKRKVVKLVPILTSYTPFIR